MWHLVSRPKCDKSMSPKVITISKKYKYKSLTNSSDLSLGGNVNGIHTYTRALWKLKLIFNWFNGKWCQLSEKHLGKIRVYWF